MLYTLNPQGNPIYRTLHRTLIWNHYRISITEPLKGYLRAVNFTPRPWTLNPKPRRHLARKLGWRAFGLGASSGCFIGLGIGVKGFKPTEMIQASILRFWGTGFSGFSGFRSSGLGLRVLGFRIFSGSRIQAFLGHRCCKIALRVMFFLRLALIWGAW